MSAPDFASRQIARPLTTSIESDESFTFSGDDGGVGSPGAIENGPVSCGDAAIAWPVHFTDPSGQYAIGQLCTGTSPPLPSVNRNDAPFATAPRGQGTPQLTPCVVGGGV